MQHSFPFSRSGFLPHSVVGTLIIVVLLGGAFECSVVHAADGPGFSLQPVFYDPSQPATRSYFIFNTRPTTILHSRVRVTNSGTAAGTASLYAVDATTGQTGGLVYLSHNDARRDVGNWITLSNSQLTLDPGQSQDVPFQLVIPSIVRPGQHVGAIVVESKPISVKSTPGISSIHINVQNLTIIAVQVNLPGTPVEQLLATGIQSGGENRYQSLLLGLDNTGTVLLKPYGNLRVTDAQGHLLQKLPIKLDTFLPQTAINYPVYVKGSALGVGEYQVALTLMYGHNHVLHYTKAFTITQQQIQQVFRPSTPPQTPELWGNILGTLPLWQLVLGGLLLASGIFFWGQKLYRLATVSRHRASRKWK